MKLSHRRKLIHKKGTLRKWREARQRRRLRRAQRSRAMGGYIRCEDSCFSRDSEEVVSLAQPRIDSYRPLPIVVVKDIDPEIAAGINKALKGFARAAKLSSDAAQQLSKSQPPKGVWAKVKALASRLSFGWKTPQKHSL